MQTKFLLDSGDPDEYREIAELFKKNGSELWGATTNPTLIAKKLANKKVNKEKAFQLQKEIVLEIIDIVPGAVSAEVYADKNTKALEMIEQGKEIRKWHERVVVKLPTTLEGFKARTELRKAGILINNTLVFSQEQIFAICLHEQIIQKTEGWPPFISPFVGRLDDKGIDGMSLVEHGMRIKKMFEVELWMLEASVRNVEHIERGIKAGVELLTAPAKVYHEWFSQGAPINHPKGVHINLAPIEYWEPPKDLFAIKTIDEFMQAIESGRLNIHHELTDAGIEKFASDWKAIISS